MLHHFSLHKTHSKSVVIISLTCMFKNLIANMNGTPQCALCCGIQGMGQDSIKTVYIEVDGILTVLLDSLDNSNVCGAVLDEKLCLAIKDHRIVVFIFA